MSSQYQQIPPNANLSPSEKLKFYHQLTRIRQFEQRAIISYKFGLIGGFLPSSIGQEAVAVGTIPLLGKYDHLITTYRHTHHSLVKGMNMNECMAELFGKVTGCSKGKGGALSFFAPEINHWGSYPVAGAQLPLGIGIAFALKYKNLPGCCLCFVGDGEINQGAVHESFNLAALFQLPIVFIIENNDFAFCQRSRNVSAFQHSLSERADGYGIAHDRFTDHDLYEIRAKTQAAIDRAREHQLPTVLEIDTYRYYGLSLTDSNHHQYRTPQEIEERKENFDPIKLWGEQLLSEKIASEDELRYIMKAALNEAKAAAEFAKNSPFPTREDVTKHVYWELDNRPDDSHGRHFFH